jgi:tetratricopeptide (TPR) repeat protein
MAVDILKQGMSRVKTGREDMRLFLSRYYSAQERYEAVVNILDGLIDSETDDVPTLFTLGSALERVGQVDSSIAVFERLLKLQPNFHPALNYLGYMLADQGIRLREAKQMIEDALAQDSLNPAYLDSYGWVLFKMGDLDEAEKYIRKALEQMQNDVVIWDHLAEIYYARGLREQAREMWEKALALDPDNATIREKLDR